MNEWTTARDVAVVSEELLFVGIGANVNLTGI
jgi:hypothetical protein